MAVAALLIEVVFFGLAFGLCSERRFGTPMLDRLLEQAAQVRASRAPFDPGGRSEIEPSERQPVGSQWASPAEALYRASDRPTAHRL